MYTRCFTFVMIGALPYMFVHACVLELYRMFKSVTSLLVSLSICLHPRHCYIISEPVLAIIVDHRCFFTVSALFQFYNLLSTKWSPIVVYRIQNDRRQCTLTVATDCKITCLPQMPRFLFNCPP